ncbi:MAG: 1-acyl-sn-glycerol-3-phosphate acyltransferase [Phaeodactylibacter sp.]|nr:1-acyl-sn-glycerol-3-phosphate acyltransferase [Phaeodactylibacter sp.]
MLKKIWYPIRGGLRLLLFVLMSLVFISGVMLRALMFGADLKRAQRQRRNFAIRLSKALGVRVQIEGIGYFDGACIYVSNHRSYFDPVAASHQIDVMAIAKKEVRKWPIIGFGVHATGTIFVDRSDKGSRQATREAIEVYLEKGHSILIYPEGTTHVHPQTIEFRPSAFGIAARLGIPVIPIAIEYSAKEDAWVGDDTFLPHFLQSFGKPHLEVRLAYGPPMYGNDGEQLQQAVKGWIDEKMLELQGAFGISAC